MLANVEAARLEGLQLVAEGRELGLPLAMSRLAVQIMLRSRGVAVPSDILAFLSKGQVSDDQVKDWRLPVGG